MSPIESGRSTERLGFLIEEKRARHNVSNITILLNVGFGFPWSIGKECNCASEGNGGWWRYGIVVGQICTNLP